MKRLTLFAAMCTLLTTTVFAQQKISVIPQPVSLSAGKGSFIINNGTAIQFSSTGEDLQFEANFLKDAIKNISSINLPVNKPSSKKQIKLTLETIDGIGLEGYVLQIKPTLISIKANTKTGIFYGIQTLLQVLKIVQTSDKSAAFAFPCLSITDYPNFAWRGLHLDVCRHFFPVEFIKEYIDLLARYKMNTFHWHLVDDQGWRIEIKKYPKLTSIGAWRNGTIIGHYPGESNDNKAYGGFYTQEQIKNIIQYAAQRHVTIIPEIEMPGHSSAAIAAYPFLSCFPSQPTIIPPASLNIISQKSIDEQKAGRIKLVQETWGIFDDVFCAGKDSTFLFLQDVLDEVMALFPSKYIHLGGDECPKTNWKNCPLCQQRIKELGLKDEEELQSYFVQRMEKYVNSKGKIIIGWDEILEGGLAPNAVVMSWRGEAGGVAAAQAKHNVIMTPDVPCYLNYYQTGPEGEPIAIGGLNTLKQVYNYNPIPKELNTEQAKYVLGAQGNLWTEYISSEKEVEYMLLPRMLALSEVLWSPSSTKNWNNFYERLQPSFNFFEQKGYSFSKGNFNIYFTPSTGNNTLKVALTTEVPAADIYYTQDGSEPTINSTKYTAPIAVTSTSYLKAVAALNGTIMSKISSQQRFVIHKAFGANVTYVNANSPRYSAEGANTLTNGIRGTLVTSQNWHGFNGKDLIATIDLGEVKNIHSISIGCLQRYLDWIFLPQYVKFETSTDGVNFVEAGTVNNNISVDKKEPLIKDFSVSLSHPADAKFIRITAKILDEAPKGSPAEGKPVWIFADEVIVE